MDFPETLSLSLSLYIRPYHPFLLVGNPDCLKNLRADARKFLLVGQHWCVTVGESKNNFANHLMRTYSALCRILCSLQTKKKGMNQSLSTCVFIQHLHPEQDVAQSQFLVDGLIWFGLFNGISTFVGYFMPKLFS